MNLKAGDGALDLDEFSDGTFEICIDHEGTGDEGGTVRLEWVANITAAELRAIGEAFIAAANAAPSQEPKP